MKKTIRFDQFAQHLLSETILADSTFNLQRAQFRQEAKGYDLSSDQLSLEEVTFTFYLKKHTPSLFRRILLWLRGINPLLLFDLSNASQDAIAVQLAVKRASAFSPMTASDGETELPLPAGSHVRV